MVATRVWAPLGYSDRYLGVIGVEGSTPTERGRKYTMARAKISKAMREALEKAGHRTASQTGKGKPKSPARVKAEEFILANLPDEGNLVTFVPQDVKDGATFPKAMRPLKVKCSASILAEALKAVLPEGYDVTSDRGARIVGNFGGGED